jgi:hypothetical protein
LPYHQHCRRRLSSLSQPILDEIENRLTLPSPAPIIDGRGQAVPDLRSELAEHARYFREKAYLETARPDRHIIRLLDEAHADLNKGAARGVLTTAANEARFHCAEALRILEGNRPADQPDHVPPRAADAIRKAAMALRQDDPARDSSAVFVYPTCSARFRCSLALEYLEKSEENREAAPSRSAPRTRPGKDDPDRER